jgi:hypothetical protein
VRRGVEAASALAERAQSECARSMRAVDADLDTPLAFPKSIWGRERKEEKKV